MSLCCSLHLVTPRHCRAVLLPALLGDADATRALTRWVKTVAPENPTPPEEVVLALQEQWTEALQHGIDADDFLAAGVFWNYGLLCGCALPVHAVEGFSLSYLEEAGLRAVARLGVRPQGTLFADRTGTPLPGAPDWIATESHAGFVADEMAGGVVPAELVPPMLEALEADLPGHARRLAQSGRDPRRCLEALLGALRLAKRSGLAVLELTGAVAGLRCLLPRENVRADGYLPVDVQVQVDVANALREANLAAPAADAVVAASAQVQGALADAVRLDTDEPAFRQAYTEPDRPAYQGEPTEAEAPLSPSDRTVPDRPAYVEEPAGADPAASEGVETEPRQTDAPTAEPEPLELADVEPSLPEPTAFETTVSEPTADETTAPAPEMAEPAAPEPAPTEPARPEPVESIALPPPPPPPIAAPLTPEPVESEATDPEPTAPEASPDESTGAIAPPPASTVPEPAAVELATPEPPAPTGTRILPAFSGFVSDRPKKKAVLQTRIISFQAADLSHLAFGLPPLKPGDTATPNAFRLRARVIPATAAAEARLQSADGKRIRAFRGTPPIDRHSPESAEGFWSRVSHSLTDLAQRIEADAHESGIWVERVDLSLDAEARRDESGLHLEDAKLQLRAHGWPWVLRDRGALLPKLLSRAVYLWLADSPVRGRVRLRRPQLTSLDPRRADPKLVRTRPKRPLGQRLPGLVELGPRAVSALLKQATSKSNTWRTEATLALIAIRDRRALRTLGDLAGSRGPACPPFRVKIGRHELCSEGPPHDDYTLRDIASWGLGLWSHQDRIGTTRRIRHDTAFWKRFVGEHGEETDEAWRLLAIERASDVLCSGDVLERMAAAERLGDPDLAGREAARALEVVLATKEPEAVLRAAVEAAMRCRSKSLIPNLLTLLDDPRLPPGATILSGMRPLGVRDLAARAILRAHRTPLPEIESEPDPTDGARLAYPDEALHAVVMRARKLAAV